MTRLEEMKVLATEEAIKLKQHATKQEILSLDASEIDPTDENLCIYGQMTGDCYSDRATDLIINCCPRVYEAGQDMGGIDKSGKLNGQPFAVQNRCFAYHSAIEMVILEDYGGKDAQQKIVAFLKDETQTLEL